MEVTGLGGGRLIGISHSKDGKNWRRRGGGSTQFKDESINSLPSGS